MFTVDIRINGAIISFIHGVNITPDFMDTKEPNIYAYKYFEPETGKTKEGTLKHKRDEGLNKLVLRILKECV